MDRFAVFVDAGYLYAGTGRLLFKTRDRRAIRLDVPGVNGLLNRLVEEGCRLPPLRTYWYDGARGGTPTAEQQRIAALPDVKLRLGRINKKNQQKGVDALILLDLVALARERAISEAYLLSGDDDLREGVRVAQGMGVRVTLIGIPTSDGSRNQSKELVNEADKSVMLNKDDLERLATRIQPRQAPAHSLSAHTDLVADASAAGAKYARQWFDRAIYDEIESLLAGRPVIPVPLDAGLLGAVEKEVGGSLRGHENLRRAARDAFWEQIARSLDQHQPP